MRATATNKDKEEQKQMEKRRKGEKKTERDGGEVVEEGETTRRGLVWNTN